MPTSLESHQTVLVFEADRSAARQIQVCLEAAGFRVPRPCTNAMEALAAVAASVPDVVVMDAAMLDVPGRAHELVDSVASRRVPVIYLVAQPEPKTIARAVLEHHAAGVLARPVTERQLLAQVHLVLAARQRRPSRLEVPSRMSADEKLRMIAAIAADVPPLRDAVPASRRRVPSANTSELTRTLSARERQVVDLLANGARVSTIAARLDLSPHTVRNHLKSILRKLNLHGQHELFEYWQAHGA